MVLGPCCSFWNFDALFQPQQHPARDAHDTFFLTRMPSSHLLAALVCQLIVQWSQNQLACSISALSVSNFLQLVAVAYCMPLARLLLHPGVSAPRT